MRPVAEEKKNKHRAGATVHFPSRGNKGKDGGDTWRTPHMGHLVWRKARC
jgi:hypothetical protein